MRMMITRLRGIELFEGLQVLLVFLFVNKWIKVLMKMFFIGNIVKNSLSASSFFLAFSPFSQFGFQNLRFWLF